MSRQRPERVQEALRQEISRIVQTEIKDPRMGFITITKVDLTRDLRYARVFFSVLGKDSDKNLTLRALNSAKGYIKGLISDRIKLRYMPEISFKIDDSGEYSIQIMTLLNSIEKERIDGKDHKPDKEA
jgi:ribosome-binding factor A